MLDVLTPREIEILQLVGRGPSNAEIARDLSVSLATAKSHVGSILSKLHLRDRGHAVILANENGLLHSEPRTSHDR